MATRYILSSAVDHKRVPVGRLYDGGAEARAAARDLNALLPALRLEVIEVAMDDLSSQPPEIREHVRRCQASHK